MLQRGKPCFIICDICGSCQRCDDIVLYKPASGHKMIVVSVAHRKYDTRLYFDICSMKCLRSLAEIGISGGSGLVECPDDIPEEHQ